MLPFVVAPKKGYEEVLVGNEDIGILKFEKREDLSMVERNFIKEQDLFNYPKELATLAKQISRETGTHFVYVNDRINADFFNLFIEGDSVKVISDREELEAIRNQSGAVVDVEYDAELNLKSVTVEIDSKEVKVPPKDLELIQPEWYFLYYQEIQDLKKAYTDSFRIKDIAYATAIIRFRSLPDWTIEHTSDPSEIKPQLVKEVAQFAYKEQNGWIEIKPSEPQPSTEEELGKSSTEATT